jgi:hypothetical protein
LHGHLLLVGIKPAGDAFGSRSEIDTHVTADGTRRS